MSGPYAGDPDATYPETIPILDDADPRQAASVAPALEGLADRGAIARRELTLLQVLNWEPFAEVGPGAQVPIAISYDPDLQRWFVLVRNGSSAQIVYSSCDCITWVEDLNLASPNELNTLCADGGTCFAGGNVVRRRTGTSSPSWTTPTLANLVEVNKVVFDPVSGNHIAVGVQTGPGAAFWTSSDGGATWAIVLGDYFSQTTIDGCVTAGGVTVAWVGTHYWVSEDGGGTWDHRTFPVSIDALAGSDDGTEWMASDGAGLYYSDDLTTWTACNVPDGDGDPNALAHLRGAWITTTEGNDGTGFARHGVLSYSFDAGDSWRSLGLNTIMMQWPNVGPRREALYRNADGRLAVLGCDDATSGIVQMARGLAIIAPENTA